MKATTTFAAFALASLGLFSCQGAGQNNIGTNKALSAQSIPGEQLQYFITADSANRMITSYLVSIGDTGGIVNQENIQSLILDAGALRSYLSDTSIKHVKVMFAHTLDYINRGHYGQPAGYKPHALTVIISGYNNAGNYVLAPGNSVPDHAEPCPTSCSVTGTSASPLLPTTSGQ